MLYERGVWGCKIVGALQSGKSMALITNESRGRRTAKGLSAQLALRAAILAIAFSAAGIIDSAVAADVSPQAVNAKLKYCEVCHGESARGFVGFYPIPRLAGQQVEYIENELKGFIEHKRANVESPTATNVMFNVGHVLSPEMIKALTQRLHDLNPKPVGGAPQAHVAEGESIFKEGIPSAKVPACASCHGPDAKGNGPIPRLAGQLYPYVVKQLTNWGHERREENSQIMAPVAHGLTKPQIEAVAEYVSGLQ
jgi:cytochrome c553